MALGGLSTGLTSPPLASAVARFVHPTAQAKANGIINAGTAIGIVISGAAAIAFADKWRTLYTAFACLGLVTTFWIWWATPPRSTDQDAATFRWCDVKAAGAVSLMKSSFLVGLSSTAIWTFGANIMREQLGFSVDEVAIGWVVLGTIGIAGSLAGAIVQLFRLQAVHRFSVACMSLALATLAAASAYTPLAYIALGLFGAAYIATTGVLLLWGISIYPKQPALGLGAPFLVLALGQTAGAPIFGLVWDTGGSVLALLIFAALVASGSSFTELEEPCVDEKPQL